MSIIWSNSCTDCLAKHDSRNNDFNCVFQLVMNPTFYVTHCLFELKGRVCSMHEIEREKLFYFFRLKLLLRKITLTSYHWWCLQRVMVLGKQPLYFFRGTSYWNPNITMINKNMSLPKLSKRTIQYSIQWLMQIVCKNHCIQSQMRK